MSKEGEEADVSQERPGDLLLKARLAKGVTLEQIASDTRVPMRQLLALESNNFASMPAVAYAIGFARSYARAVDLDENMIAQAVREDMGVMSVNARNEAFIPIDPARVPPRWLALAAAAFAVLLAVGYGVWRSQFSSAPTHTEIEAEPVSVPENAATTAKPAPAPVQGGAVVLTATNEVWLRIYDQNGDRLMEKVMQKGEAFTVPANANNPMILTGRPDVLSVTVGGKAVAPLGPPEKTISDVPISAAALLARPPAPPAAAALPAPAPVSQR
jgi:cytoskeleton protein RodZ